MMNHDDFGGINPGKPWDTGSPTPLMLEVGPKIDRYIYIWIYIYIYGSYIYNIYIYYSDTSNYE